MTLDELKERIKNEVVLREGDLFDWQWRQLGLVAEAEELGVPSGEFLALVNEVSRAINPYFGRISDLKIKVADLARLQRKQLTDAQIRQITDDAGRLQLQPDFVTEQWIPAILATVPEPTELPEEPVSPVQEVPPVVAATVPVELPPTPAPQPPPAPSINKVTASAPDHTAVTRKVHQFLDEYVADKHIPARVLKPLFLATNFDETVLAEAVLTYLSANFYAAETPAQGQVLKDKLLSTDWRHLSWWETVAPVVPAAAPVASSQPRRNGSSDTTVIGLSVLMVGLLIGGVWWSMREKPVSTPVTVQQPAERITSEPVPKAKTKRKRRTKGSRSDSAAIRRNTAKDSAR